MSGQTWGEPHIGWLEDVLMCKSFQEVDDQGHNILHHLYKISNISALAIQLIINLMAFPPSWTKDLLAGDLRQACSQMAPNGWTPLHYFFTHEKHVIQDFNVPNDTVIIFVY